VTPLPLLRPGQARAADPRAHAWVSASAGAGKTQLLAARVLRLLLAGAAPGRLLALTFTKAAAAEMRGRVLDRLGAWAAADDAALDADLAALGAVAGEAARSRARALFALALDARGGLRIETIHAFAAGLLAAFPFEAGVPPDFAVLDDRTAAELDRAALDTAIARPLFPGFADDLAALAVRHGEAGLDEVLRTLIRFGPAVERLGAPGGFEARVRGMLGLPREGGATEVLCAAITPPAFDHTQVEAFAALLASPHGGKAGPEKAAVLVRWLESEGAARCAGLADAAKVFVTKEGNLNSKLVLKAMHAADPGAHALAARLFDLFKAARDLAAKLEVAEIAARHLRVGAAVARERRELQERAGALAFDDIIARAAAMLADDGAAAWVRAKLDQRIDHILVDEAQDTNDDQWRIVTALSDEFFAGEGARGGHRTLFAVGDYKQSIFGFQGADPAVFAATREALAGRGAEIADVPLADNFRSVPAVLDLVDAVLARLGPDALGLSAPVPAHIAARAGEPGQVTLWPPVGDASGADEEDAERGWVSSNARAMAARVAGQIRAWLDAGTPLPARGRAIAPGDVLVLIRKRGPFVGALVAALHRVGVPVAGADRLALNASLAVKDMLSLIRFALQPGDDLALAEVLVSPLMGWSQDALFAVAHGREGTLWRALRDSLTPDARDAAERLRAILASVDFVTPYQFLEAVLSGAAGGRARALARLGEAERLALDELLAAALAYEADHAPSLQGFLAWIEAGDAELKRDPDGPGDAVRIMTVHGAKGLQAPLVILADAALPPQAERAKHVIVPVDGVPVPIFHGGAVGKLGVVGEACEAAQALTDAEQMRLLYVALTRAEDMLFVGGALHKRKEDAPDTSWYAIIGAALGDLGARTQQDALWEGTTLTHSPAGEARRPEPGAIAASAMLPLPEWARQIAPVEARPPRPLTPSRIGVDDAARPPGGAASAERGRLLHALFQRLPTAPPATRAEAGAAWLARAAAGMAADERGALLADALAVVDDPAYAALFGPGSLAEAPLAATIGDTVIAGTVDRLLIEAARVLVVDFKTGVRVPSSANAAPPAHVRQMAAYHAALSSIFPDRAVKAALLYTAGPKWIALSDEVMARHGVIGENGGESER